MPSISRPPTTALSCVLCSVLGTTMARSLNPSRRGAVKAARVACGAVPQVTLFTKPGCTLCDKAVTELKKTSQSFELSTVNIDAPGNEAWKARYWCDIPVFHLNGAFWTKHCLDTEDVEASLAAAAEGTFTQRDGEPDSREEVSVTDCCGDDCNCGGQCCEDH